MINTATVQLPAAVVLRHLWWSGDSFGPISSILSGTDEDWFLTDIEFDHLTQLVTVQLSNEREVSGN